MGKTVKTIVLTLLFLSLSASTALLAYLHFFASDEGNLSGEWTAELDMTEQAAVTALGWLQDIEAVSITLEETESYMQGLTISVNLSFEQTGRSRGTTQGTFSCHILPENYEACREAAYEAFAMAFRELVAQRLRMAGYAGGTDRDAVEALVEQTFGMSTVSYLMSCGPALLPSLEELQAAYDGSGTYEAGEGILTRQFDAGGTAVSKMECYIREGSRLILSQGSDLVPFAADSEHYPMEYTLETNQDQ